MPAQTIITRRDLRYGHGADEHLTVHVEARRLDAEEDQARPWAIEIYGIKAIIGHHGEVYNDNMLDFAETDMRAEEPSADELAGILREQVAQIEDVAREREEERRLCPPHEGMGRAR